MHSDDFVPLVNLVGIWFQIRDDYMNLQSDQARPFTLIKLSCAMTNAQYAANKGFAEDLTEGKFSFPLVHAIRADPSNLMLISASYALVYARLHVTIAQTFFDSDRAIHRPNSTPSST